MKKKIIYFCILLGMLTMISGCKKKENDDVVTLKFMHRWTMEPMDSSVADFRICKCNNVLFPICQICIL